MHLEFQFNPQVKTVPAHSQIAHTDSTNKCLHRHPSYTYSCFLKNSDFSFNKVRLSCVFYQQNRTGFVNKICIYIILKFFWSGADTHKIDTEGPLLEKSKLNSLPQ